MAQQNLGLSPPGESMKSYRHLYGALAVLWICSASAQAQSNCDQRFAELNERFSAAYISLESDCFPSDAPPVVSSDCSVMVPELTPECQARRDALAAETSTAWDEFYRNCPDYQKPTPAEGAPGDEVHTTADGRANNKAPVTKAPSKQELFATMNKLKKQVSSLKKSLRKERTKRQNTERRCRLR